MWGHSSAGRAPALQAGGRRFDPDWLHHFLSGKNEFFMPFYAALSSLTICYNNTVIKTNIHYEYDFRLFQKCYERWRKSMDLYTIAV